LAYDAFFKQLVREFFQNVKIHPDFTVGNLPLSIDLIINPKPTGPFKYLQWFFALLKEENIFEYKSSHDSPRTKDLVKLMGYLGLYAHQCNLILSDLFENVTLWYISVKTPLFFNDCLKNRVFQPTATSGLFEIKIPFPCHYYLVVVDQLEVVFDNLPLLLLSTGIQYKNTLQLLKQTDLRSDPLVQKYLTLNYYINYREVTQMEGVAELLPDDIKTNIRMAIEHIGIQKMIDAVGIKEVVDQIGIKEVVDQIGIKEVVDQIGIKEVLKELLKSHSKSEIEELLNKMEK
jgi:hypothetical protein